MTLLTVAIAAQWLDAMTYVLGVSTMVPVELSPVAAYGPGATLLVKAGAMSLVLLSSLRWKRAPGWRVAGWFALIAGVAGVVMNARAIAGAS
jgi:hypothetical protein